MPTSQFPRNSASLKTRKSAAAAAIPLLVLFAVLPATAAVPGAAVASRPRAAAQARVQAAYARLPLSFEENLGQVKNGREVQFLSRGSGYTLYLTESGAVLALRQPGGSKTAAPTVVRMQLAGAHSTTSMSALEEQPGKSNYFIGNNPSTWRTGVAHYGRVAERGVYPGIDLVYHGNQGQLEYDFEVAPGADARAIRLMLDGARKLRTDAQGNLIVSVQGGELLFHAPVAYQEIGGVRRVVPSRYALRKRNQVEFRLAKYDRRRPLVIDPTLAYSTYLGGSNIDTANGIAVAPDNTAFIAGGTFSTDFPTEHALQPNAGGPSDFPQDAFVSKISADGATLLYSTYMGGSGTDSAQGIAVDTFGDAYVAGYTDSADFPVTPLAFNTLCGSDGECGATYNKAGFIVFNGFVTAFNTAGSALNYSTLIAGYQQIECNAIALDSAHDAYVAGEVGPPIVPEQNGPAGYFTTYRGFQTVAGGAGDAFVLKLDATASFPLYASYIGGSDEDIGFGIAADSNENAYVTGLTYSGTTDPTPFPVTANALQSGYGGGGDAFLTKVNTNATGAASLLYSTYIGGTALEQGRAAAVDTSGNAYLTGTTTSTAGTLGFTVPVGAYQPDCKLDTVGQCEGDAFIAKLDATKSGAASLLYFTYLGGSGADAGYGIALDPSNNVYLTGSTVSSDFPVTAGVFQAQYGGGNADAFVSKLTLGGAGASDLDYSTYLGGSNTDTGYGMAVDTSGSAYVAGQSCSVDFPIAHALQAEQTGNCDAFISEVTTIASGLALNPAGLIFATQNVNTTSQPEIVTLTNLADTAVTIDSIAISGDFAETNTCGASVAGNGTCTISVTFTPTESGPQKGTITLTDSAPGSPQIINLTGSTSSVTLSASNLSFGDQALGALSSPLTLTVTNIGTTALTISSVAVSGAFSESTTDNGDCVKAPLQPSTDCVIAVTFTPVIVGSTTGALAINDSAVGSPQVVLLTGTGVAEPAVTLSATSLTFASQIVNTTSDAQVLTITNSGTAPLTISGVTATAGFAETNTCTASVAAGGICTISVTFTPTAAGAALGTLTITDNAANSPQVVSLTGTGAASPIVSLSPTSLTFAAQDLTTASSPQSITLKNTGGAALAITSITSSGDFAQTNTCGSSVAAGASCAINVTFTPTVAGSRNGSVTITDNAADSPQAVLLAGTGSAAPAVSLSVTSLNFVAQPVGTTATAQTVTVTNSGTANLTITSVAATGAFTQTNTCGATLAPQGTCIASVAFAPTVAGTASGTLTLTDNAPNSPQSVSLGGSGSDFSVKTTPASGSIVAGSTGSFKVTVTPSFGFNATVVIACAGLPAASTCTVSPNSLTPDGVDPATTTLTIGTTVRTMAPPGRTPKPQLPGVGALPTLWLTTLLALLGMAALAASRRRPRLALAVLSLTLFALLGFAACGGGSGYVNPTGTPSGNYSINVTGTSGGLSHTATINLTVQ
ncbi:MAG TPA: choice-of-anchor D domain-containing protein [Terriglobia bacterium]|nr:choice-of-anchor D domain-containing protein [Terriglobia bacterium]